MSQTQSKILLAGPWIGEFGWELFCWQAYIRFMSKDYDKTIIIGRPTNEFLYKDFCDEYIKFDPESHKTDAWKCHDAKSATDIIKSTPHSAYHNGVFDIGMRYTKNGVIDTKKLFFNRQEYFEYNAKHSVIEDNGYEVIFHCRNKSTGADRNWDKAQWEELYKLLPEDYNMACIGNSEAFHIDGTDDLRGMELEELAQVMGDSDIIVGPSSGPMHFASLCGLKHLVWSTEYNRVRYEKDWNPFKTKVVFCSEGGWNPKPLMIKNLILDNI